MSLATHINVTHMNESCHTHQRGTSHMCDVIQPIAFEVSFNQILNLKFVSHTSQFVSHVIQPIAFGVSFNQILNLKFVSHMSQFVSHMIQPIACSSSKPLQIYTLLFGGFSSIHVS